MIHPLRLYVVATHRDITAIRLPNRAKIRRRRKSSRAAAPIRRGSSSKGALLHVEPGGIDRIGPFRLEPLDDRIDLFVGELAAPRRHLALAGGRAVENDFAQRSLGMMPLVTGTVERRRIKTIGITLPPSGCAFALGTMADGAVLLINPRAERHFLRIVVAHHVTAGQGLDALSISAAARVASRQRRRDRQYHRGCNPPFHHSVLFRISGPVLLRRSPVPAAPATGCPRCRQAAYTPALHRDRRALVLHRCADGYVPGR